MGGRRNIAALAVGLAACADEARLERLTAAVAIEPTHLDFGLIPLGATSVLEVEVRSLGSTEVTLDVVERAGFRPEFTHRLAPRVLPPGGRGLLEVSFTPALLERVGSALAVQPRDADAAPAELSLEGYGSRFPLRVVPQALDFGNVVVGTTRRLPIEVTLLQSDAQIETLLGNNVELCSDPPTGPGVFCVRRADGPLDAQGAFPLTTGGTAVLEVSFTPLTEGTRSDGTFELRSCSIQGCAVPLRLTGVAVGVGLACTPAALDFGRVPLGQTARRALSCAGLTDAPTTFLGAGRSAETQAVFSVPTAGVRVLGKGDTATVAVDFAPEQPGAHTGVLQVETVAGRQVGVIDIPLRGEGGSPDVHVAPAVLDLGRVAVGAEARRTLVVSNRGTLPLEISSVELDDPSAAFRLQPPFTGRLEVGEAQSVTVALAPPREGSMQATLRLRSDDADRPVLEVPVRGEGFRAPPCAYTVTPRSLELGAVALGRSRRRGIVVQNTASASDVERVCFLSAVGLGPGAGPGFSVPAALEGTIAVPPGAARMIAVDFRPDQPGTQAGELELFVSSPTSPEARISLRGQGVEPHLIAFPEELDFGAVEPGCGGPLRVATLQNIGTAPVRVEAIQLSPGTSPTVFAMVPPPPFPTGAISLAPGGTVGVEVRFRPDRLGPHVGAVEVETFQNGRQRIVVPLVGLGLNGRHHVEELEQGGIPKADVLFVIDDSGSMGDEQEALAQNLRAFIRTAEGSNIDYHLGVVTTDTDLDAGRLCSAAAGQTSTPFGPATHRVVTPSTRPSPTEVFGWNVRTGTTGAGIERPFQAALMALSPPTRDGHNAGFLRTDASLAVVVISDERDMSLSLPLEAQLDLFHAVKGRDRKNLFSLSAIVAPHPPGECRAPDGGLARTDERYTFMVERSGGAQSSICDSSWARALEHVAPAALGTRARFFLRNPAVPGSVRVSIDGMEIPPDRGGVSNWRLHEEASAVEFSSHSIPEPGATIRIEYETQCG